MAAAARTSARARRVPEPEAAARACWVGLRVQPLTADRGRDRGGAGAARLRAERRALHAHITLGRVQGARRPKPWTRSASATGDDFGGCAHRELIALSQRLAPRRRGVYEAVDDPVRRLDRETMSRAIAIHGGLVALSAATRSRYDRCRTRSPRGAGEGERHGESTRIASARSTWPSARSRSSSARARS